MILGITGPTGSGKTTLLQLIAQQGGTVLDCDAIYHGLLRTDPVLLQRIEDRFPGTVENGSLNRKALGAIVFSDPAALKDLNAITHAAVKQEVLRRLEHNPALAAIDAIGLFEGDLASLCDVTVAVIAPEDQRLARLMARDSITRAYAQSRIASQPDAAWYSSRCHHTLLNDTTVSDFQSKCIAFLQALDIM